MNSLISFCFVIISFTALPAQLYVVGDTTGRFLYNTEYAFPNSIAEIDIDCDDSIDIKFSSHIGGQYQYDWPRLSFNLFNETKVFYSAAHAPPTVFSPGDTIDLSDTLWVDYGTIYGQGSNGSYGTPRIDTQYLAFRKIEDPDTTYLFLKISTLRAWMIIHQIISECPDNPLTIFTATDEAGKDENLQVYPNPFSEHITFSTLTNTTITLYVWDSRLSPIWKETFANTTTLYTSGLATGIYFYLVTDDKGIIRTGKVIRQ